ncbi:MAG: hypothetical protein NVS2B9_04910 [Myxococcales bacterium]
MSPLRAILVAVLAICLAGFVADTQRLYARLLGLGLRVSRRRALVPGHLMRAYLAECSASGRRPELRLIGPRALWSAGIWIALVALLYAP